MSNAAQTGWPARELCELSRFQGTSARHDRQAPETHQARSTKHQTPATVHIVPERASSCPPPPVLVIDPGRRRTIEKAPQSWEVDVCHHDGDLTYTFMGGS